MPKPGNTTTSRAPAPRVARRTLQPARIRRILVPLDGSTIAEQALAAAGRIAAHHGASLHVVRVHLAEAFGEVGWFAGLDGALRVEEQRYLQSIVQRLSERHEIEARSRLLDTPVRDALGRYVIGERIDLVVMTTHGRTGVRRAWLGSIADHMVRTSPVPVLMIRPTAKRVRQQRPLAFTRIVVPLDGSSSAEAILPPALAVSPPDGDVLLLRIVEPVTIPEHPYGYAAPAALPDAEAIERLVTAATHYLGVIADRIRRARPSARVRTNVYVDRRPAKAILDATVRFDARLVCMTTHGGGATRVLVGSTADKILRASSVPLLLFRPAVE